VDKESIHVRTIRIRVDSQQGLTHITNLTKDMNIKVKVGKTYTQKPLPYWEGMPKFSQVKKDPYALIILETSLSSDALTDVLGQSITDKTKSIWFPKKSRKPPKAWYSDTVNKPKYPIYIISKGRPKCMTAKALDKMGVDYRIVVEPPDLFSYLLEHDTCKMMVTPFSDLGQGSIPVRNWVWEHSISEGHDWHWILDDNIEDFNLLRDNTKYSVRTGNMFRHAEDFVGLHDNIGQAGFNYYNFCKANDPVPPYYTNTRIYSCILIRNDLEFRWRGKYNEDTDLSIRILKSGLCTVLFNMFLAGKVTTMRMAGGNTDHVYIDGDNRLKFAESLRDQHPDIVKVTKKFKRWHHQVDYRGFKQLLNRVQSPEFKHDTYTLGDRK